jgi:hypothetical protein
MSLFKGSTQCKPNLNGEVRGCNIAHLESRLGDFASVFVRLVINTEESAFEIPLVLICLNAEGMTNAEDSLKRCIESAHAFEGILVCTIPGCVC